jgi:hypothetical protein
MAAARLPIVSGERVVRALRKAAIIRQTGLTVEEFSEFL